MRTVRVVFILLLAKVTVVTLYVLYEKKCKQLVIDDTSDEDQLPEPWIWKEIRNSPKIWNYTKTPGIKEAALRQLGGNKRELDIFNIIVLDQNRIL
ncbi:hypothetical protein K0M31_015847 [Melipona bicolor]|uniref:Uncharacterized protein n=1 Tax=Melipona bicolor TaxID=60889 RepID=A0AA40FER6_9HYME|nr:hypothetical protein K0M31_015847 [Melipona bicolor]